MNISSSQLTNIFENGIECPFMFRYRTNPDSVMDSFSATDLAYHSGQGSGSSVFISTSYNYSKAIRYAGKSGYVLKIELDKDRGIDLNALFGKHSYAWEEEVAAAFFVPTDCIIKAYEIKDGLNVRTILNPNYYVLTAKSFNETLN